MNERIENITYAAIVLLFLYILNKTYTLYSKRKRYPTGDLPLPIFGNILSLAVNLNRNPVHYFRKLAQKYGDVYTFWLGSEPVIIVNDCELAKRLLNMTEFSDRYDESVIGELSPNLVMEKTIAIENYDEEFKALRKVSIEAIRKYLQTDNLAVKLRKIVDNTANIMMERECEKEFIPFKYIESIFVRLLIEAAFGEKVAYDSPVLSHIINSFELVSENLMKIFVGEYFPPMKLFHNKSAHISVTKQTNELMRSWFHSNLQSYRSDSTETLTHLVYSAKLRYLSVKQNELYEKYLSDKNLIGSMFTLFIAASDTSLNTFKWILLLMAYYPEMQRTMRDEIKCNFGNKYPDSCDKEMCHFVNAFICEILRFRNVLPLSLFHRTKCDTNIGEIAIPKGIEIIINQYFMLNDPKYWENPEVFNPNRFLNSDNCFDKTNLPAFIPFSTGKRMCIGDKFSSNSLFLTTAYLLQATNGYQFTLVNRETSDLESKTFGYVLEPKVYKISIKKDI